MAAMRAGIKTLVLPEDCRRDWDELPEYLKDGLEFQFASDYSSVYNVAFGSR
jgi:ATP-dependent Lon protease